MKVICDHSDKCPSKCWEGFPHENFGCSNICKCQVIKEMVKCVPMTPTAND